VSQDLKKERSIHTLRAHKTAPEFTVKQSKKLRRTQGGCIQKRSHPCTSYSNDTKSRAKRNTKRSLRRGKRHYIRGNNKKKKMISHWKLWRPDTNGTSFKC
jgi:hypothetical protein